MASAAAGVIRVATDRLAAFHPATSFFISNHRHPSSSCSSTTAVNDFALKMKKMKWSLIRPSLEACWLYEPAYLNEVVE